MNFFAVSGIFIQLNANLSEHFIYSGIAGIVIYLPLFLKKFIKKEKVFTFLLCILCLIYGIRSVLRNFDWKNPEKFFEKIGEEANYPTRAKVQLVLILLNKGDYKKAYEILKNEFEKNQNDEDISLNYGASLIRLGKYQEAENVYKKILKRNPRNYKVFHDLTVIYEEKGDWDKAFFYRQSINKWLKKRDQDILALYKVQSGLSFVEQGLEHEARIRFREALKLTKTCIPAYLYWGDSYRREGKGHGSGLAYMVLI